MIEDQQQLVFEYNPTPEQIQADELEEAEHLARIKAMHPLWEITELTKQMSIKLTEISKKLKNIKT